jgi:hypothetical protein
LLKYAHYIMSTETLSQTYPEQIAGLPLAERAATVLAQLQEQGVPDSQTFGEALLVLAEAAKAPEDTAVGGFYFDPRNTPDFTSKRAHDDITAEEMSLSDAVADIDEHIGQPNLWMYASTRKSQLLKVLEAETPGDLPKDNDLKLFDGNLAAYQQQAERRLQLSTDLFAAASKLPPELQGRINSPAAQRRLGEVLTGKTSSSAEPDAAPELAQAVPAVEAPARPEPARKAVHHNKADAVAAPRSADLGEATTTEPEPTAAEPVVITLDPPAGPAVLEQARHRMLTSSTDAPSQAVAPGGKHALGVDAAPSVAAAPAQDELNMRTADMSKEVRDRVLANLGRAHHDSMAEPILDPSEKGMRARARRIMQRAKLARMDFEDGRLNQNPDFIKFKAASKRSAERFAGNSRAAGKFAGNVMLKAAVSGSVNTYRAGARANQYFNDEQKGEQRRRAYRRTVGALGLVAAGATISYGVGLDGLEALGHGILSGDHQSHAEHAGKAAKHAAKAARRTHEIVKGDTYSELEAKLHPNVSPAKLVQLTRETMRRNGDTYRTARALKIGRKILLK